MNLTVDIGNSRIKASVFNASEELDAQVYTNAQKYDIEELINKYPINAAIISSVATPDATFTAWLSGKVQHIMELTHETPVPIKNGYDTPETLGMDRLAAVVGAWSLKPNVPLLVIDAGSAITYDFLSADGVYKGGNIAPGAVMRLRALHEFTGRLPKVSLLENRRNRLMGSDTRSAILGGVINGIAFEIEGYIANLMKENSNLEVFFTGGDAIFFEKQIKSSIFVVSNLTALGLNAILNYNFSK